MSLSFVNNLALENSGEKELIFYYGMANSLDNILGKSFIKFSHMALLRQISLSFGSKNHKMMGVYQQRALLISFFYSVIITPL